MTLGLASQERSSHVPSPPRLFVPPLIVDDSSQNQLDLFQGSLNGFKPIQLADIDYLNSAISCDFQFRDDTIEWRYEERRQAQPILPFLYLGPFSAARDPQFLEQHGITMVLAVRDPMTAQVNLLNPKAPRDSGLHVVYLDVQKNQQLIPIFDRAVDEINSHLVSYSETGIPKILVFCESGNERSATVVAAYIMSSYSLNVIQAIQLVQSQRICVAIGDNYRFLLQSYESILEAKRDVVKQINSSLCTGKEDGAASLRESLQSDAQKPRNAKRTVLELYEDEQDMTQPSNQQLDTERFESRESSAPFADLEYLGSR